MLRWIIFILIYVLIDLYAFQALRTLTKNLWIHWAYLLVSLGILAAFIYQLGNISGVHTMAPYRMYVFGFFLVVFIPKLILVIFMLGEDVIRLVAGLSSKLGITGQNEGFYMPSRRKFLSVIAVGIAAIPFTSLLYGMYKGRYNYKVLMYNLEFDDLPAAFDGYSITQISDIHCGSFDNAEMVQYAVDLINKQKSDVILFTGDLVNNSAQELSPWKKTFSQLSAEDGVFSVLGNHDYGDYVQWNSDSEKAKNFTDLKEVQREMGWDLLLNENRVLERNGERISLIGVENWGAGRFKKAGDLDKACVGVPDDAFKIVMSHDPSHWQSQLKEDKRNFQLTLSGHTHGMQFGIEIPGWIKWSPAKYRYENWAGIYEEFGRYINVNRGLGFIGYPGRAGIWPEISVITLKKRSNTA